VDDDALMAVLRQAVDAVAAALAGLDDWGPAGTRPGQYRCDLVADEAALAVLDRAGLGAVSEESGVHHPDRPVVVMLDPVDGSTNASQGLPWYATSLCALDDDGPRAAVVANQASGRCWEAVRGGGARRDGRPIAPSACTVVADSIVGLSGYPAHDLGWRQYRALGAAALDLCAVAEGTLDGYVDCSPVPLAPWDYLGALLVCTEAGAVVAEAQSRELVVRGHGERRTVVAAGTPELLAALLEERATFP